MLLPLPADCHAYLTGGIAARAAATFLMRNRPQVPPAGSTNFAVVGQVAVYGLLKLDKEPPAIYKRQHAPTVRFEAVDMLHR